MYRPSRLHSTHPANYRAHKATDVHFKVLHAGKLGVTARSQGMNSKQAGMYAHPALTFLTLIACLNCRKSKIKCKRDEGAPNCERCTHLGAACVIPEFHIGRQKGVKKWVVRQQFKRHTDYVLANDPGLRKPSTRLKKQSRNASLMRLPTSIHWSSCKSCSMTQKMRIAHHCRKLLDRIT